jgi:hypothetical protein
VFCVFCVLIISISIAFTYYATFYDANLDTKEKIGVTELCDDSNSILDSMYTKIIVAFFAGGIVSDKLFLKLAVF